MVILRAVGIDTFHSNPKRQRGNELTPSLAFRVGFGSNRGQYNNDPCRLVRQVSEINRLEQIIISDQTPATSCGR